MNDKEILDHLYENYFNPFFKYIWNENLIKNIVQELNIINKPYNPFCEEL
jgi:hypothetical protein